MFGYAYRQLVAEGEGLKRRREVQRVAMNKAAKSSTNLVTFDSPTGVLRKVIFSILSRIFQKILRYVRLLSHW